MALTTDNDVDAKTPLLNPVIVSMLALPLLQIVSLPQQCDIVSDCQTTARHLLSVVHQYTTTRHYHSRQRTDTSLAHSLGLVMPSPVSHVCHAYVRLAQHLSTAGDCDVYDWLQQATHSLLSATSLQPSVVLTLFVTSLFLVRDDSTTLDCCLQLLHVVCQSDKTQVHQLNVLRQKSLDICYLLLLMLLRLPFLLLGYIRCRLLQSMIPASLSQSVYHSCGLFKNGRTNLVRDRDS